MRQSARAVVIKDNQLLVIDRNKFGNRYLAIPGGGIEIGEDPESAAHRELLEECSIVIDNLKLIIKEDAGEIFGQQYIYLADYVSGEAKLDPDSEEYKITAKGQNLYQPMWLDASKLADSNLLPLQLRDLLASFIKDGFPDNPVELQISADSKL